MNSKSINIKETIFLKGTDENEMIDLRSKKSTDSKRLNVPAKKRKKRINKSLNILQNLSGTSVPISLFFSFAQ